MPGTADAMPATIGQVLDDLRRDVMADPEGRLSLGGRIRLWDASRTAYGAAESDRRRGVLGYLVAREAAATWDLAKLPDDLAADEQFQVFPGRYLEAARQFLLGNVGPEHIKAVFGPLWDYIDWLEVMNNDGYAAMMQLQICLLGEDDEIYEDEGYFEIVRNGGPDYLEISDYQEHHEDVHSMAEIQAGGVVSEDDNGGPAGIAARRGFWRRWLDETAPRVFGSRESLNALLDEPTGPGSVTDPLTRK